MRTRQIALQFRDINGGTNLAAATRETVSSPLLAGPVFLKSATLATDGAGVGIAVDIGYAPKAVLETRVSATPLATPRKWVSIFEIDPVNGFSESNGVNAASQGALIDGLPNVDFVFPINHLIDQLEQFVVVFSMLNNNSGAGTASRFHWWLSLVEDVPADCLALLIG